MEKTYTLEEALVGIMGMQSKAVMTVIVASLAALRSNGALTDQAIQDDVLRVLRDSAKAWREDGEPHDEENETAFRNRMAASHLDALVDAMERDLFPETS